MSGYVGLMSGLTMSGFVGLCRAYVGLNVGLCRAMSGLCRAYVAYVGLCRAYVGLMSGFVGLIVGLIVGLVVVGLVVGLNCLDSGALTRGLDSVPSQGL